MIRCTIQIRKMVNHGLPSAVCPALRAFHQAAEADSRSHAKLVSDPTAYPRAR